MPSTQITGVWVVQNPAWFTGAPIPLLPPPFWALSTRLQAQFLSLTESWSPLPPRFQIAGSWNTCSVPWIILLNSRPLSYSALPRSLPPWRRQRAASQLPCQEATPDVCRGGGHCPPISQTWVCRFAKAQVQARLLLPLYPSPAAPSSLLENLC